MSLNRYLNQEKNTGFGFECVAITKGAAGQDVRYNKYGLAVGYWFPSMYETASVIRLNQGFLSYPDRAVARSDHKINFDYYLSQAVLEETAMLSYITHHWCKCCIGINRHFVLRITFFFICIKNHWNSQSALKNISFLQQTINF